MKSTPKKTLAQMLLDAQVITSEQFERAKKEAKGGQPMRKVLVALGIISEEDMVNFIAQNLNVPRIELTNHLIDPKVIALVPEKLARKHEIVPVLKIGTALTCAMADVFDIYALDEVRNTTGLNIEPAIATEKEIKRALDEYYSVSGDLNEVIVALSDKELAIDSDQYAALKQLGEDPPVIKLVNMLIMQAVHDGASDLHIEPEEKTLVVRYRIDGLLHQKQDLPKHFQPAILSRFKILASMDIAERRRPQDGRFQMNIEGRAIDIRVSCVPTIYGENIVLRLLDTSLGLLSLEQIGLGETTLIQYKKMLASSNGIILVTGPTGSGKTTTLYASLSLLNSSEKNIITIEDPVEYRLAGIRQIQVNPEIDLSFANGLRSILRQDPDIIMVGEIRDLETAEIAIQSALTGHLVLSTLHTNSAAGAVTRLIDMGIEPFLISSSVIAVLAQRLVRTYCKECHGKGCEKCFSKGYKGRTGIYELMVINEELRRLTARKASADDITQAAAQFGMKSLRDDGMEKVEKKLTSKEEIMRVTQEGAEIT
jgi:type IV pilus assembly protein PilB